MSSLAVFEATIRVTSTHMIASCLKTRKKENMEIKQIFLHKSPSKRSFRHRIRSSISRADARGSADIIYRIWRISLVCGSGMVIASARRSLISSQQQCKCFVINDSLLFWLMHYVKIITLLLSPKNVHDAVQGEDNLQGGPKKVCHCHESSLNRIKTHH